MTRSLEVEVRTGTITRWIAVGFAGCLGAGRIRADSTNDMAELRSTYERALVEIRETRERNLGPLPEQYLKALTGLEEQAIRDGDLQGTLAIGKERERFEIERTVPVESGTELPAEVRVLQGKYRQATARAESEARRQELALAREYVKRLSLLERSLTQQRRLGEALRVYEEKQRVVATATGEETAEAPPDAIDEGGRAVVALPEELKPGLVLYYPFSGRGRKAADESGGGNVGTVHRATYNPMGQRGGAYEFDGKGAWIEADRPVDPNRFLDLSVAAWFKADELLPRAPVFAWDAEKWGGGIFARVADGMLEYQFGSGSTATRYAEVCPVEAGVWHHVAIVHNHGFSDNLYLDGERRHFSGKTRILSKNNVTFRVGGGRMETKEMHYFSGMIDEVLVYDRALTPEEVKKLYDLQK